MNTFANAIVDSTTLTTTENGAVTYSTSLDPVVDMFFQIAAKRGHDYNSIVNIVKPAFEADEELAFRTSLWLRDIRQGAGERQTFRHILRFMIENNYIHLVERAADAVINEIGRGDDLFVILEHKDTPANTKKQVLWLIINELKIGNAALMAKWIPRKGPINSMIRNEMGLSAKEFRKLIVRLTNVVETKMCAKQWGEINYSHVPSVAMSRYRKAFGRNDQTRFGEYIERVKSRAANPQTGKIEKINAGALYPYDVIKGKLTYSYSSCSHDLQLDPTEEALWNSLPDFVPENISFLPVIDTSSSMLASVGNSGTNCMEVAVSLGIYLAERNKGPFKDLWLNFSTTPKFNKLKGESIAEKISNLDYRNWQGSTDLEAAFKLIIKTAVDNQVPASDMPNYLLVLSDMEFNQWGNKAPGKQVRELFEQHGYKAPNIVWWNIQSRNGSTPVRSNEYGMALVSGLSPSIVSNLLQGDITPFSIMMNTIMKDRYSY